MGGELRWLTGVPAQLHCSCTEPTLGGSSITHYPNLRPVKQPLRWQMRLGLTGTYMSRGFYLLLSLSMPTLSFRRMVCVPCSQYIARNAGILKRVCRKIPEQRSPDQANGEKDATDPRPFK